MSKLAVSVTLDPVNVLWLRGRVASRQKRSLSEALDEVLTAARLGGRGGDAARSVVGTVDIASDDPRLEHADAALVAWFEASLRRPHGAAAARIPEPRSTARGRRPQASRSPARPGRRRG